MGLGLGLTLTLNPKGFLNQVILHLEASQHVYGCSFEPASLHEG